MRVPASPIPAEYSETCPTSLLTRLRASQIYFIPSSHESCILVRKGHIKCLKTAQRSRNGGSSLEVTLQFSSAGLRVNCSHK